MWETKQIEKTQVKVNNYTHKTIFTWFGNLLTSTELQGFHYKIRRYNSAREHSQETQFPIHHNSLSPTRQEKTILSSYAAAARFLGITLSSILFFLPHIIKHIYIHVTLSSRLLGFLIQLVLGQFLWPDWAWLGLMGLWQNSSHTSRTHFNKSPPWLELIKLH